jgi:hypothetical protein
VTIGILADCEHQRRGSHTQRPPATCAFSAACMTTNTYQAHSTHSRYSNRGPVIGLGGGRSPVTRRIGERDSSWSGRVRTQSTHQASGPSGRRRLVLVCHASPPPRPCRGGHDAEHDMRRGAEAGLPRALIGRHGDDYIIAVSVRQRRASQKGSERQKIVFTPNCKSHQVIFQLETFRRSLA